MGFFASFWTWLNTQLGTYIGDNTARVASVLEPAIVTLATLYVMVWGYLQLTGSVEEPFVSGPQADTHPCSGDRRVTADVALQHRHRRYVLQGAGPARRCRHRHGRSGSDG